MTKNTRRNRVSWLYWQNTVIFYHFTQIRCIPIQILIIQRFSDSDLGLPVIWSAFSGLWIRLVTLKALVWGFFPCYPVHEVLNRISSVLVWDASVARRVQRSPKPIWFSTEQVNLMSLKRRREEWLFPPDIARTLQQTGPAENGLCVATQVIRENERVIHKPDE